MFDGNGEERTSARNADRRMVGVRSRAQLRSNDRKCIAKTFPDYFTAFAGIAREAGY